MDSNHPKTAEPHWAKGIGENADMGWQLFIVEVNERTGRLVVRFANALHTEFAKSPKSIEPWFTPSPDRWARWTVVKKPK